MKVLIGAFTIIFMKIFLFLNHTEVCFLYIYKKDRIFKKEKNKKKETIGKLFF